MRDELHRLPAKRLFRRRFTLVEMLVVIAIIGVLAALLMPSLGRAVDSARSAFCANSLKNNVAAAQIYANDYAGSYLAFGVLNSPSSGGGRATIYWYQPLTGRNPPVDAYHATFSSYLEGDGTLACPSQTYPVFSPQKSNGSASCYGKFSDWGSTATPGQPDRFPLNYERSIVKIGATDKGVELIRFGKIRRASSALFLADTLRSAYLTQFYQFGKTINWTHSSTGGAHLRHLESANAAFYDGHVSSLGVDGWDKLGQTLYGELCTGYNWSNTRFDLWIGAEYAQLPGASAP